MVQQVSVSGSLSRDGLTGELQWYTSGAPAGVPLRQIFACGWIRRAGAHAGRSFQRFRQPAQPSGRRGYSPAWPPAWPPCQLSSSPLHLEPPCALQRTQHHSSWKFLGAMQHCDLGKLPQAEALTVT